MTTSSELQNHPNRQVLIHATGSEPIIIPRELVRECLLTVKSANSYWFCFPGAGEFMKCYIRGRNAVLSTIRKSKYQQILRPVIVVNHAFKHCLADAIRYRNCYRVE